MTEVRVVVSVVVVGETMIVVSVSGVSVVVVVVVVGEVRTVVQVCSSSSEKGSATGLSVVVAVVVEGEVSVVVKRLEVVITEVRVVEAVVVDGVVRVMVEGGSGADSVMVRVFFVVDTSVVVRGSSDVDWSANTVVIVVDVVVGSLMLCTLPIFGSNIQIVMCDVTKLGGGR